jgi:Nif-specific regulatory protein
MNELKEITLLFDISIALTKSKNIKELLHQVLAMMARYMGMERGTITLLRKSKSEIFIEEAYELSEEEKERGKYKLGEGIIGKVVESEMSVFIPRISDEPQFLDKTKAREKINKEDVSFLCVPIKYGTEVIGTLSVDRLFNNNLSFEDDIRLISIIASMIAQALKARQEEHEEIERLQEENARLQSELEMEYHPANVIGNGPAMKEVYRLISLVAPRDTSVMISGESGVGKELIARTLHHNSARSKKDFVEFNTGGMHEKVMTQELLGGAGQDEESAGGKRRGKLLLADEGTLYLTEISDLTLKLQSLLLKLLQTGSLELPGEKRTIQVSVRLIAGTNRNLERLVEQGKFMEELFFHLNAFSLYIPPLRDRKSDIPQLVDHFIERYNKIHQLNIKRISTSAIDMMMSYHWPGNVRELEKCIERAAILATKGVIYGFHLPPTLQTPEATTSPERGPLQNVLNKVEKELIQDNLKLTRGNISQAAENLGITVRTMTQRIARHGIDIEKYTIMR